VKRRHFITLIAGALMFRWRTSSAATAPRIFPYMRAVVGPSRRYILQGALAQAGPWVPLAAQDERGRLGTALERHGVNDFTAERYRIGEVACAWEIVGLTEE
jgi:hypothetical protein